MGIGAELVPQSPVLAGVAQRPAEVESGLGPPDRG